MQEKDINQIKVKITQTNLFINNKFVPAKTNKKFPTINPSTEEVIAEVWEAGKEDVNDAVLAARAAFEASSPWRRMSSYDRSQLLHKLADLLEQHADEFTSLDSLDNGKPYMHCRNFDIAQCIQTFRYYAGWCDKISGQTISIPGPYQCYTRKEPVGVCGLIVPWNFPLLMAVWKLAPALSCGCTVILKPAEQTPLSALKLAELFVQAGFPPGVVNILTGFGQTGAYIVDHPLVDKISFTGSTEIGQHIMQKCSINNLKKITLELGGKSPLIVLPDADIKQSVDIAHSGLFFNQGQVCCASSRIFVHESIYDEFVRLSVEKAKNIKVGDPFDMNTFQGPQVDKAQFDKVLNYIKKGVEQGAKLECGGQREGYRGYFIQPTVFSNVKDDMIIAKEEIFGPSMQILKFSTIDEAIKRANNTAYGLAASIQTKDVNQVLKVVNALQCGTVYVNCYDVFYAGVPFGGYKLSGFGKDLGEECLKNYLQSKIVVVKQSDDTLGF